MKNYEKSDWMRGLLDAEEMYQMGFLLDLKSPQSMKFVHPSGSTHTLWSDNPMLYAWDTGLC